MFYSPSFFYTIKTLDRWQQIVLLLVILLIAQGSPLAKERTDIANQLILKARIQKIWQQRDWQLLLHYSPSFTAAKFTSLVDDPDFFLSEHGKTSQQAELEATIKKLFSSSIDKNKFIACRFPARLAFLIKALAIDHQDLTPHVCQHLDNWLKNLQSDSLTLVFPVSVLNSPGSMFGHTFLRFDRKTEKKPDLLAWTVNYAAQSNGERGLGFAIKGLFGGYPGKFTLAPYHSRVKEYSDIESRDIWEYQLNFNQTEIQSLLLHLWELLPSYFNYYFIDENCSYQLLSLLEVAKPELKLTEKFIWDASPATTIQAIANTPGLLKNISYRPSIRQFITARASQLSYTNRQLARKLAMAEIPLDDNRLGKINLGTQAKILELAYEYATYLETVKKHKPFLFDTSKPDKQHLLYQLLLARNQLDIASQRPNITKPSHRPDQGHKGHRIGIRYGYEDPLQFVQLDFRWAYHDLYDPSEGFIRGSQLAFFKPAIRYYPQKNQLQLESIDFVNIISSPVQNYFIRPFSWKISAAIKRHRFSKHYRPLMGDFNFGLGASYALTEDSYISIFANTSLLIADDFNQHIALSSGLNVHGISKITNRWQAGFYAQVEQYYQGISQTSYRFGSTQRYSLGRNQAIVVDVAKVQEFGEVFLHAQLSWQLYF